MGNWLGYFFVVLAAAVFGASSVVIKYTYSTGLEPIPVLIMQNLIGLALAWSWAALSGRGVRVPAALLPRLAAQGVVGGFLTSILFYTALGQIGAALATLLLFTYPAFVVLYNVIAGKSRPTAAQRVALIMALAGVAMCIDPGEIRWGTVAAGAVMMALASAVTNAFLSINAEGLLAVLEMPIFLAWSTTFSTVMLLIAYRPVWLLAVSLSWQQAALVLTGALIFVAPLVFYLAGLKRIGAGPASIISTAEIPFTLLLAWFFLQEVLTALQLAGGVLITVSVYILCRYRQE